MDEQGDQTQMDAGTSSRPAQPSSATGLGMVGDQWIVMDEEKLHAIIKNGVSSGMWRFYWQALLITIGIIVLLQIVIGIAFGGGGL